MYFYRKLVCRVFFVLIRIIIIKKNQICNVIEIIYNIDIWCLYKFIIMC